LNSADDAVLDVVIIAPTVGTNHGHVRIVGKNKAGLFK
jgi:hypothetical protein